jgi:RNA-directed DNA polymerase
VTDDQAAKGQSPRSSRRAGKPSTGRRGTAQAASKQDGKDSPESAAPNGASHTVNMQRKLYAWSRANPERTFDDLFNLVHHPTTLQEAWHRVSRRKASLTTGVDGVSRSRIEQSAGGVRQFLDHLRGELKAGTYQPRPVREHLIPKPGKPGKYRALGIPTVRDRVVQTALKLVLEPIFEAGFFPCSYGFRPGRSTLDAIIHVAQFMWPNETRNTPYSYVIEGDIKACFDNVDHHLLMDRLRRRIADKRVLRLVRLFLHAGVMSEGTLRHPALGTPQGGVISPLLANVYLQAIEERYHRHTQGPYEGTTRASNARGYDVRCKRPVYSIVRYADYFVILVVGSRQQAEEEKAALTEYIRTVLRMELSVEKTLVTPVTDGFNFLGYRIRLARARFSRKLVPKPTIPSEATARLRSKVRSLTRRTQSWDMQELLYALNPILTGWRTYYKFALGAYDVFARLDMFVWRRIQRWLRTKYPTWTAHQVRRRFGTRLDAHQIWIDRGVALRRLIDGGTERYKYRGPLIHNGWDDRATGPLAVRRSTGTLRYAMRLLEGIKANPRS